MSRTGAGGDAVKVSFAARQEDHFQKKRPERTFRSEFVKLGSEILYLFLAEKCSFVCFVCLLQYFVRFWLILIYIYFKKSEALIELRKMLSFIIYIPRWIVFELWGFLDSNFD